MRSNKTKNINVKILSMIYRNTESKSLVKHMTVDVGLIVKNVIQGKNRKLISVYMNVKSQ